MARHHSDAEIIAALESCAGFVSAAATKLGMSASAVYRRLGRSEKIRLALQEIKDRNLDFAESQLLAAIKDREAWAICFYLKCQGKSRGYIEQPQKLELVGSVGISGITPELYDELVSGGESSAA